MSLSIDGGAPVKGEGMEPVRRRKLSDEVLDRLIAAIATREFPPGSQLPPSGS